VTNEKAAIGRTSGVKFLQKIYKPEMAVMQALNIVDYPHEPCRLSFIVKVKLTSVKPWLQ